MLTETVGLTLEEYGAYTDSTRSDFRARWRHTRRPRVCSRPAENQRQGLAAHTREANHGRPIYVADNTLRSTHADREIESFRRKAEHSQMAGLISAAKRSLTSKDRGKFDRSSTEVRPKFDRSSDRSYAKVSQNHQMISMVEFNRRSTIQKQIQKQIREKKGAPPSSFGNDVVASKKEGVGEQSEPPKIVVGDYLAQQIQRKVFPMSLLRAGPHRITLSA